MGYKIDSLDPATTAVLVVDMENDFVEEGAPMEAAQARAAVPHMQHALRIARQSDMKVIYTTHVHRSDGSDVGRYGDLYPPIASQAGLVDGTRGIEIYDELTPEAGEALVKKHRYSAFFGTDLDMILRSCGMETIVIMGTTTENCCLATARDAMYLDYFVVVLADAAGTFNYPNTGWGAMTANEVHRATLTILSFSTAHVRMSRSSKTESSRRWARLLAAIGLWVVNWRSGWIPSI